MPTAAAIHQAVTALIDDAELDSRGAQFTDEVRAVSSRTIPEDALPASGDGLWRTVWAHRQGKEVMLVLPAIGCFRIFARSLPAMPY